MWDPTRLQPVSYNFPYQPAIRDEPILLFKPGACGRRPRAWFLEIVLVRALVCVSVCPPPRPLITSGMIWCDIGCVRLVKQVLRLFPAFNYFIRHLPSIKWMGVAILT